MQEATHKKKSDQIGANVNDGLHIVVILVIVFLSSLLNFPEYLIVILPATYIFLLLLFRSKKNTKGIIRLFLFLGVLIGIRLLLKFFNFE